MYSIATSVVQVENSSQEEQFQPYISIASIPRHLMLNVLRHLILNVTAKGMDLLTFATVN